MNELKDKYEISYSQNREDIIIRAFFPDVKKGFYVDVGANHPFYHSVTKIFYDVGWRGINIEPNPMLIKQIEEHRPRDFNLALGVGDKNGQLDLRIYHSQDGLEGMSTLATNIKADHKAHVDDDNKNYTDLKIEVKTLANILSTAKPPHIHFLKIDVEGYEYEVLSGNDWQKYRPELICIESNHMMKDWRPILKQAQYECVFNDGINDYYLAQESIKRRNNFDYAKVFLSSKPVVEFHLSEQLRSALETLELKRVQIKNLEDHIKQKDELINKQEKLLEEITPLKKHIRRQVRVKAARAKRRITK